MTCPITPRKGTRPISQSRSQSPDLPNERRQHNSVMDNAHGGVVSSNSLPPMTCEWDVVAHGAASVPTGSNIPINMGISSAPDSRMGSFNALTDDGWTTPTTNKVQNVYHMNSSPGQYPWTRLPGNVHHPNGQMIVMPNGGAPMAHGPSWFHRSPEHFARFPDTRFPLPPSPTGGPPLYTGGYPAFPPSQLHHGQIDYTQIPGVFRDDAQRHFQGMTIEEGLHPQFPHPQIPFNTYNPSEYSSYFPAPPPEPFTDYSFAFDPSRPQGRPSFPLPFRNAPVASHYHPNAQPLHPNHVVSDTGPQQGRFPFEYTPNSRSPPQFFFPSPPQILLTPPMLQGPHPGTGMRNHSPHTNENILPHNDYHRPSGSPRKPQGSNTNTQPKRVIRHSSQSAPDHTPTSGNIRLVRRVNNLSHQPRSLLLEEFRNNREKHWELKAIFGHIVEFSGDQHGSRFIQHKLEEATDEDKEAVFKEIVPNKTDDLVRDVFGNYVIQKFFEFGTPSQVNILTADIEDQVDQLSLQIYGCRVVQKALESISAEQQSSIIRRLEHHILTCIKDAHGNHVVQKLVEVVAPERLTFLPVICDHIFELATHPYGCRVLQRCLEHLPEAYTRSLLDAIHCYTVDLMKDQYGNYVIQFILEQGQDHDKAVVLSSIRGNLIRLAQHKYASNVCEKALVCTDSESRHILINEIMVANPCVAGESPILTMVKDQYANYVLQRALTLSEGEQREAFFNQVKPLLIGLRKSTMTYSRPLVSMERLMDKYFNKQTITDSSDEVTPGLAEQRTAPRRSL